MSLSHLRLVGLGIAIFLVASLSLHTFIDHQHFGEYSDEHGEHSDRSTTTIQEFYHSQDKKLFLWMLLILISSLAISQGKRIHKEIYSTFISIVRIIEYQDFITPFREAFRKGIIQPKLY